MSPFNSILLNNNHWKQQIVWSCTSFHSIFEKKKRKSGSNVEEIATRVKLLIWFWNLTQIVLGGNKVNSTLILCTAGWPHYMTHEVAIILDKSHRWATLWCVCCIKWAFLAFFFFFFLHNLIFWMQMLSFQHAKWIQLNQHKYRPPFWSSQKTRIGQVVMLINSNITNAWHYNLLVCD